MSPTPVGLSARDSFSVRRRYTDFWSRLWSITPAARQIPEDLIRVEEKLGSGQLLVETPERECVLALEGVKSRQTAAKDLQHDVYIQFRQLVRAMSLDGARGPLEAVQSNVRVQYLEARSPGRVAKELRREIDPARLYAGVHFDLALGEGTTFKRGHPIYHVQFDPHCVPMEASRRVYEPWSSIPSCDVPRIPTPPMDLGAVVYLLLQDHFPDVMQQGWPTGIQKAAANLPRLPIASFNGAFGAGRIFDVTWWYGHG